MGFFYSIPSLKTFITSCRHMTTPSLHHFAKLLIFLEFKLYYLSRINTWIVAFVWHRSIFSHHYMHEKQIYNILQLYRWHDMSELEINVFPKFEDYWICDSTYWRAVDLSLHVVCGRNCPATLNTTLVNFDQTSASKCCAFWKKSMKNKWRTLPWSNANRK